MAAPKSGDPPVRTLLTHRHAHDSHSSSPNTHSVNPEYTEAAELVTLRPSERGIMLHTMYYLDEIRDVAEFKPHKDLVNDKELKLAKVLIESLVDKFKPEQYKDTFRENLKKLIEAYGLLTILPSEGSDGNERVVVVSGTYSAGMAAAMEFFASGPRMRELRDRLQREGQKGFPPAYQVVVKATTDSTLPLRALS